ncbi:MAG: hypothetical protein ACI9MR_002229 [Myxococcota bacterium]
MSLRTLIGGRSPLWGWPFFVLASLPLCLGCGEAKTPAAETAAVRPSAPTDADRVLVELKGEAKKRLMADRAVSKNTFGYSQARERHERLRTESDMGRHLPRTAIEAKPVIAVIQKTAADLGIIASDVVIGATLPVTALPSEHTGARPFVYEPNQLLERTRIRLTLETGDEAVSRTLHAALLGAPMPLLRIEQHSVDGTTTTLVGVLYREATITAPRHVLPEVTLASLAKDAGVAVPAGHPRLGEVEALVREHAGLRPDLLSARKALVESHLAATRSRFYTELLKQIRKAPLGETTP